MSWSDVQCNKEQFSWTVEKELWLGEKGLVELVYTTEATYDGRWLVAKLCLTLETPWTAARQALPGTSQARILEWVAISFSKGSSPPRDRTFISCIGRQVLLHWARDRRQTTVASTRFPSLLHETLRWETVQEKRVPFILWLLHPLLCCFSL